MKKDQNVIAPANYPQAAEIVKAMQDSVKPRLGKQAGIAPAGRKSK